MRHSRHRSWLDKNANPEENKGILPVQGSVVESGGSSAEEILSKANNCVCAFMVKLKNLIGHSVEERLPTTKFLHDRRTTLLF